MGKNLYSLMLNDEVVDAIDRMAHRQGLTRSAMVNRVLAEYASVLTPEQRINDIFSCIEKIFDESSDIVPLISANQQTMALKSSLDYKYRPTVRYEVELKRASDKSIGTLSVIFRTQSSALLSEMVDFFEYWKMLEDKYLPGVKGVNDAEYVLCGNRFVRSISISENETAASGDIAEKISSYINMFDALMKEYLGGRAQRGEIEMKYCGYLRKGIGII